MRSRIHNQDDWVRMELEAARKSSKHILPILVNGGRMPFRQSLPSSISFFSTINAVSLRDDSWEANFTHLLKELESLTKHPIEYSEDESEAFDSKIRIPRRRILGLVIAPLTALMAWGLWRLSLGKNQPQALPMRPEPYAPIVVLD